MILHDSLYVDHLLFILRVTGRGRVESLTAETDGLIIFVPFRILAGIPLPVVIVWAIVKANWFTYTSNETHVRRSPSLSFLFCFVSYLEENLSYITRELHSRPTLLDST